MNDHKGEIVKLSVAIVFFIASMLLDKLGSGTVCEYLSAGLAIVAYLIAGLDVVIAAVRNLVKGEAFDESLLMTIATVGAFALKDFREGAARVKRSTQAVLPLPVWKCLKTQCT